MTPLPCSSDDAPATFTLPPDIDVVHITFAPAVSVVYAARGTVRGTDRTPDALRTVVGFLTKVKEGCNAER